MHCCSIRQVKGLHQGSVSNMTSNASVLLSTDSMGPVLQTEPPVGNSVGIKRKQNASDTALAVKVCAEPAVGAATITAAAYAAGFDSGGGLHGSGRLLVPLAKRMRTGAGAAPYTGQGQQVKYHIACF